MALRIKEIIKEKGIILQKIVCKRGINSVG